MASPENGAVDIPRPATEEEYSRFLDLADGDDGWTQKLDKPDSGIWTRQEKGSNVNMLKARIDYDDVDASVLYDVLHDPYFRRVWDDNMIDGFEICQIDAHTDLGYYSMRWPTPLSNRDYVNVRAWRATAKEYIIFNHSVPHPKMPLRPGFVRGISFLSGYLIRPLEKGCRFYYVSHNDPQGQIPSFIINKAMTILVPKIGDKLRSACLQYPGWKADHQPDYKPWLDSASENSSEDLPNYEDSLSRDLVDARGKLLVKSTAEQGMDAARAEPATAAPASEKDDEGIAAADDAGEVEP